MNQKRPTALYRHFDAHGKLLYIGVAGKVMRRLIEHQYGSPWFDDVVTITIERFPSWAEAKRAEDAAIQNERPFFNKAHNPTRPARVRCASAIQPVDLAELRRLAKL